MQREIRITGDGSPTIYQPDIDEHYHSIHGAVQEAQHVFIENGLKDFLNQSEISILEIGFGSGLNALLSCLEIEEKTQSKIVYLGIESNPLSEEENLLIDYSKQIENSNCTNIYQKIIHADWNEYQMICSQFELKKHQSKVEDYKFPFEKFDLIFYDAFGPRAQEEMWKKERFEPLFKTLKTNGILVTYCAQGQFKRNLKEIGFQVESRPGPPGKREMTIARKIFK
jgi:tRNA U34 5-methylaminomethyl-2-thiouridine-forming methyltransferase MnmC